MKMLNRQVVVGIVGRRCCPPPRSTPSRPANDPAFRPPAVPLVTSDPYLSIWSMADRLTDDTTRHWTRREHPLVSLIRIDGRAYRLMGTEPKNVPAMKQVGVRVLPTRSIYDFDDGHVHVTLTFLTPALPEDLDVLARPLTYLTWDVRSVDGIAHVVSIYDSTSALLAVNSPDQKVEWARPAIGRSDGACAWGPSTRRCSNRPATIRASTGAMRMSPPRPRNRKRRSARAQSLLDHFVRTRRRSRWRRHPHASRGRRSIRRAWRLPFDLGSVGSEPVSRHLMIAYDEILCHQVSRPEAAALLAARRSDPGRSAPVGRARLRRISCGGARRSTRS